MTLFFRAKEEVQRCCYSVTNSAEGGGCFLLTIVMTRLFSNRNHLGIMTTLGPNEAQTKMFFFVIIFNQTIIFLKPQP